MLKNPVVLKEIKKEYIPKTIIKCIIPDSVICISYAAFAYSKLLTSIIISNNVTSIGSWAFYDCESLKEIIIPNSVKSISYGAFAHCNLLKEVIFKGKTLAEVKQMKNYPFGIEDESIIKCEIKD